MKTYLAKIFGWVRLHTMALSSAYCSLLSFLQFRFRVKQPGVAQSCPRASARSTPLRQCHRRRLELD